MIETVEAANEYEISKRGFGYETFDSMIWLGEMRTVRNHSDRLRSDEPDPVKESDRLIVSLQPSLQADYPLAWVARTTGGERGTQMYGEVWSMTKSGWYCQKNELTSPRAVEQFWGYYDENVNDAPIAETLSPVELETLEKQGFVSQGVEVSAQERDEFVRFLADLLNESQERAGIGPKRTRMYEDLTLEEDTLIEQIQEQAAEVLDPFQSNWIILSTEPLLVLRRYSDADVAVGIPAAAAYVPVAGGERTMPMHYYHLSADELQRRMDEPRPLSEIFNRAAFDERTAAWRTEEGEHVGSHEANYLAEYLRTCANVSSLFADIDELAETELPKPQRIRIPETDKSAVSLRTIRHKHVDVDSPQTFQTMEMTIGDTTWMKWSYLGLYSTDDQKIRDLMLQYDRQSGVVGVVCGTISDMSKDEARALFEKNAKRFLRATTKTLPDIYAVPLGEDTDVYSSTHPARDQWWFHAANAYPALLGMIEEWKAVNHAAHQKKR